MKNEKRKKVGKRDKLASEFGAEDNSMIDARKAWQNFAKNGGSVESQAKFEIRRLG